MIYHIAEKSIWNAAQAEGLYRTPSLESEGFIHFSTQEQVVTTANRFYKGRTDLVLLAVESDHLTAPLRYENVLEHGIFPHLYGDLNVDAVVEAIPFTPGSDGYFSLSLSPE